MMNHNYLSRSLLCLGLVSICGAGCASYATPGRAADLAVFSAASRQALTDDPIQRSIAKKPLAVLPTSIAVVRVQASGYRSETAQGWGTGRYSIVTTRDIEKPEQFERLSRLPKIIGIAPINRLLLPNDLQSDLELRQAAAQLHADMLLLYTLDTTFSVEDKAAPLTFVTLGLSPNQQARLLCTASAVLMDTRNGYIYGVSEATERQSQLTSAWTSTTAVDEARRRTESAAFEKLVGQMEQTWTGVVKALASNPAARPDEVGSTSDAVGPSYQTSAGTDSRGR